MNALGPAWRAVRLDSIAEVRLGRQRSPKNHSGDQMRSYVRAANVGWRGLRLDDVKSMNFTDAEMEIYRLEPGDLLLNEASGSPSEVGKPALWQGEIDDCAFQNTLLRVRPRQVDPEYLLEFFRYQAATSKFAAASRGVGIHHLGREALSSWIVPLPSAVDQRRIVKILKGADGVRVKRREALAQLDDLTQSIFLDMFGDPASGGARWPMRKIGDLLESAAYGTSEKALLEGDLPVLRMNNITSCGDIDLRDLKFMRAESTPDRYRVRSGDVLFNRTNSTELVGKTAIYRGAGEVAYAGYLVRLRVNAGNNPEYLAAFMNTQYAKRVLRGMCKSIVGMANINAKDVQRIDIPEPPLGLQQEFAVRVAGVEQVKRIYRTSLAELDEFFASVQGRAFRGEL